MEGQVPKSASKSKGRGKNIKGSYLPSDYVSVKNPNNTTSTRPRQDHSGSGSSTKPSRNQNQKNPIPGLMNGFVNGNGLGALGHHGLNINGNGNLGNTNLGMLFSGLALKTSNSKARAGGQQGHVVKNLPAPQLSHEEQTMRLNTEALQRIDPSFKYLYGSASQVAVYDFDAVTNYWTDTKTVGCLFLYSRADKPEYGLVVLNRKGLKNLEMFFDKDSQVIPHEPYLLFRRGPNEAIKCIWFYKNSEFFAATELLKSMGVQFDQAETSRPDMSSGSSGNNASGLQLIDMLKQSQAKHADSKNGQKPLVMTAEEVESQLLQDVSGKVVEPPPGDSNPHAGRLKSLEVSESGVFLMEKFALMPSKNPNTARSDLEEKSEGSISPRLNDSSRSMRTVEQLEKDLVPEITKLSGATRKNVTSSQDISNELLATLGITPAKDNVGKAGCSVINSTDVTDVSICSDYSPKSPFMTPASRSRSESGRSGGRKLTIDDLDGKLYDDTDEDMVREVVDSLSDLTELLLLSENVVGHSEPQLVWRKRSNLQNRPASALIQLSQNIPLSQSPQVRPQSNGFPVNPDGLTRNQLLQAMTYLLQTDEDFVTKIHEAYCRSLAPSWRNNHLQ